jgi:hypothetical protein
MTLHRFRARRRRLGLWRAIVLTLAG